MRENLLCPFCGIGKPQTGFTRAYIRAKEEGHDHECKRVATVYCDSCPVQFIECYESEDAALKAWNTRTPSPELVELVKSSEAMLKHYIFLAESGDAGFWNPNEEKVVIELKAAIDAAKEKKT